MNLEDAMRRAIEIAHAGVRAGQAPFGSVLLRDSKLLAEAHNTTRSDCDPTAHAEVNVIRRAAHALGSTDCSNSVLVTTCEPCPMCLAAAYWAGVSHVVFGATIKDATAAGFDQLDLAASELAARGARRMSVQGSYLRTQCLELLQSEKKR